MKAWSIAFTQACMGRLIPFLAIVVVGLLAIRVISAIVAKALETSKLEKAAHSLIRSLIRVILYLLLGLVAASSLGIDVTGVIALASVLSLAVSLSVQNALTNIIGGFTLLSTKPFQSGDFVEIAAESGTVTEIGMSYTKLITGDHKLICIPNSAVVSADIVNYTVLGTRRVEIAVSVSYEAETESVLDALYEAAKVPGARTDPAPFAALSQYGDSAIVYTLRVWSDASNYESVYFAVTQKIRAVFQDRGISMPYPHLNVHLTQDAHDGTKDALCVKPLAK